MGVQERKGKSGRALLDEPGASQRLPAGFLAGLLAGRGGVLVPALSPTGAFFAVSFLVTFFVAMFSPMVVALRISRSFATLFQRRRVYAMRILALEHAGNARSPRVAAVASPNRAIGMVAVQQRRAGAVTGAPQHADGPAGVADALQLPDHRLLVRQVPRQLHHDRRAGRQLVDDMLGMLERVEQIPDVGPELVRQAGRRPVAFRLIGMDAPTRSQRCLRSSPVRSRPTSTART
jgi:hypothetical protein